MKNKVFYIIISILSIAFIVVLTMIVIKYGKNYQNEKEVSAILENIDKELNKIVSNTIDEEESLIDVRYKGYQIEGIIEIPKIDIKYPIISQTNEEAMKISITKFWGPEVNEIGNYTVAGHNNRDGTMFGKTKYLEIGDIIKLTNLKNETISYEIFKIYSIDPNDVTCIESIEQGTREVTLITCTNGHKNRLITKARQIV